MVIETIKKNTIKSKNKTAILFSPLTIQISKNEHGFFIQDDDLSIYVDKGNNINEIINKYQELFCDNYEFLCNEKDSDMTDSMLKLKRKMLSTVRFVELTLFD